MPDTTPTSAELDERLVAFVQYGPLRSYDHVALMERVLGPSLVMAEEVRDRLGNLTGWNLTIRSLARAGLEAGKAEESMRERAALACEAQKQGFLSPQYASNQPLGSILERFACDECATAIRALPLTGGKS